ncbi:MAG: acyl-CoA dehydrogenase family protein [Myxococcota bacterium]
MANFFTDNADLQFYFSRGLDWEKLVELVELNYQATDAPKNASDALESYRELLTLVGEFVAEEVAPRAKDLDRQGTHLGTDGVVQDGAAHQQIFTKLRELGLYGMTLPRELDGFNAPTLVYFAAAEIFSRADAGVMTHFGFHAGLAGAFCQYTMHDPRTKIDDVGRITDTPWRAMLAEIVAGKAWGSMDLTESDAGSDLAAIRSRAVKDKDGIWRLTGNKIFITSGHAKYHLVLAKTADESSLEALSLFLVPLTIERNGRTIKNGYVDRVEEKIGHHSSATCSIQFEGSEAELIGNAGDGFKLMLQLMNNARIGVGFESIGTAESAYRMACAYAAERKSMGKTLAEHEMIADYLDEMETTILGLRALAMDGAYAEETANRLQQLMRLPSFAERSDIADYKRRLSYYRRRARVITPLLKHAAAEAVVWITRMNMQIHGGNGYTQDFGAERLLRDALVMPIYEGTSQIQALMALKDHLLGAIRDPQRFVRRTAVAKVRSVRLRDPLERRYYALQDLSLSAQQAILLRIAKSKWSEAIAGPLPQFLDKFLKSWDPKRDFSYGLLHAERLARILADVQIADVLVKQAKQFPERRELAERWIERAEPRVRYNVDQIQHTGDRVLRRLQSQA